MKIKSKKQILERRREIEKDLGVKANEIDIIVAGSPCQAYSTVGKRLIDDPRGKLFQEYCRVLKEFNPKFFLFENVKGLLSMQGGELLKTIISCFESLGYEVQYKLLNAMPTFLSNAVAGAILKTFKKEEKNFNGNSPKNSSVSARRWRGVFIGGSSQNRF